MPRIDRTPEEKEKWFEEQFAQLATARAAIVKHAGPYKKGVGKAGKTDCPICKGKETLQYSRAGYNGHIHAHCSTKDCVSWME